MSNAPAHGGTAPTVQSVDRAVSVLEMLAHTGEAGVTEIAAGLGVHKSTAFRLVAALERRGLVEQHAERGKYRLGVGILRLAGATTARLDVVQESRPLCRQLAARTGETVNLTVLSDGAALYLDQVAGSSALQPHNWVGQRIPLHATSNGKVLLGGLPDAEVSALVGRRPRVYTSATLATTADVLRAVRAAREQGYAVAVDELEVGLTAVAAPLHNAHGDVVASISVSGPSFRLDGDRVGAVTTDVVDTAREASLRLGHWVSTASHV
ncbi:MAG: IclR family transcriptional regulator [Nocardioidaceae bacterium]|jgi:DNA-binding IclR family transcriptional regulator|nr:IclR family transcriptional regulator [Nocardioidaceae bacterium]